MLIRHVEVQGIHVLHDLDANQGLLWCYFGTVGVPGKSRFSWVLVTRGPPGATHAHTHVHTDGRWTEDIIKD